jgi:hypothetical protein
MLQLSASIRPSSMKEFAVSTFAESFGHLFGSLELCSLELDGRSALAEIQEMQLNGAAWRAISRKHSFMGRSTAGRVVNMINLFRATGDQMN